MFYALSFIRLDVFNVGCVNSNPNMLNFIIQSAIILSVVNAECPYTE